VQTRLRRKGLFSGKCFASNAAIGGFSVQLCTGNMPTLPDFQTFSVRLSNNVMFIEV